MNYWLLKSEPSCFSIDDLINKPHQITSWDGVRNYQARNFMRKMNVGDLGFFYHSSCKIPGIVGVIKVVKKAYPESSDPQWEMVDVQLVQKFSEIITLEKLKTIPELNNMIILRKGNRLSITPLTTQEWEILMQEAAHQSDHVIDLTLGATLVGKDIAFAKEMLKTLVNTFPDELKNLDTAHQKADWKNISDIIHRIKGGVSYCGTPRLQKISAILLDYLHSDKTNEREILYQKFLSEIAAVNDAYKTL